MPVAVKLRRFLIELALVGLVFAAVYPFTLGQPYHADSANYMWSVRHFLETGEVRSYYGSRPVAGYALLPLAPLLGEQTLPVTVALSFACGAVVSGAFFRRLFGGWVPVAGAAAALLSAAATMSVTHLKEDAVALLLVMSAAALVIRQRWWTVALGGGLFGLGVLSKELVLLLYPLLGGLAFLTLPFDRRAWRQRFGRAALAYAVSAVVVLIVQPGHFAKLMQLTADPTTGQFLGPLSEHLSIGVDQWRDGLGDPLFFAQLLAVAAVILEPDWSRRLLSALLLVQAALLGLFLVNNSVSHYRHFFWPALFALPVAARGAYLLSGLLTRPRQRWPRLRQGVVVGLLLAAIGHSLWRVLPVIRLRAAYNPVAEFYAGIPYDPEQTVLIGMDNCGLATYYSSIPCMKPPKSATAEQAEAFADEVQARLEAGRSVYTLPDAFAYDSDQQVARALGRRFVPEPAYSAWFEDYHRMGFGLELADLRDAVERETADCELRMIDREEPIAIDAPVVMREHGVECADGRTRSIRLAFTRGRYLPGLEQARLLHVLPRASE